ncbi:uncharacterized protein LOC143622122 [Bidens hawaiensis]|uniref:uncharacterized protein LOC143622122 n=1 Tax=Bidens hawaiensis TaxID=980011 RepID=UPI00404B8323
MNMPMVNTDNTLDYSNNTLTSSSNFRRMPIMSNARRSTASFITSSENCNVQNKGIEYSISKQRRSDRKNYLDARKSHALSVPEAHDTQNIINVYAGVSKDYLDHGDQNVICELCHANLWKLEAARGKSTNCYYTSYSMCCGYGKVQLPSMKEPSQAYKYLFNGSSSESKFFFKNIRRYNSMFSFTSMGGKVDSSINRGNASFIFRLSGQNYHSMGSLLPKDGSKLKFSQLYIYYTENEISNRQSVFGDTNKASTSTSRDSDLQLIQYIKNMLDSNNVLVQTYRMVRDYYKENPHLELKLRLIGNKQKDGRTYNLTTASEVAALIVGDIGDSLENRDIVVKTKEGSLIYISELNPSYLALQYPLLFIYGEDCYRVDIPYRGVGSSTLTKRQNCTMREFFFFAYIIQDRMGVFSLILNSRRLFQQFLVDVYTMIETERLNYIRYQQKELRCESFENLRNLRNHGTTDVSNIGKHVILPSSFTGGACYMM